MSFGWSAGDIATALTLAYNIYEALDSYHGASRAYREAVSFLKEVTRTLEPLKTFTALKAYPTYGKEIREQVDFIKGPVDQFLQSVRKYERSLGLKASEGRHRHIWRKVQWHVSMSDKVLSLRDTIGSHMRILDSLMHRLTLWVLFSKSKHSIQLIRSYQGT
jgi:hypothetical protein